MLDIKEYSVQKSGVPFQWLNVKLSSNFQVMKMLRKIIDGKSLDISQENVYEGVSFSKVTNLQCSDCNFAIKIARHRYFSEYVPKTSCLVKQYFEKKSLWWNSFLIKLQPCSSP